ncbi:MAG TPA: phosphoribosylglycinamide formyltransferase [Syntrophomonas sp.]|nr:phosphoribosylglycinamide formyltransferase [Syntrophomonas sp.]HRW12712.1 phosphoribosylglycinamide formyltransferase [Syntrophomonas sp.]
MKRIMEPGCLRLAILASGRGSNFLAILEAIKEGQLNACIEVLISDKEDALALQKAQEAEIPHVFIDPRLFSDRAGYESDIVKELQAREIDLVVLAGYMRLVGKVLLHAYPHRILNIHPALLPAFTGLHAQRQAVAYGVKLSGCTVHLVDDGMDTGPIIAQAVVPVLPDDSEDDLAERILVEEHKLYARVLQWFAEGRVYIEGRKVLVNHN